MYGSRAKLGFIVPANNTVLEPELYSCGVAGVSLHFTKLDLRQSDYERVDKAAAVKLLQYGGVSVIGYACMSGSLIESTAWEENVTRHTGIPAFTAATALKDALCALSAKKVAVVTYYPERLMSQLREWFNRSGFDLVASATLNVSDPHLVGEIKPDTICSLARRAYREDADVICLLATDFCSFPIIERLEQETKKTVVSSNQTILWKAMRLAALTDTVACGSLFNR
jgi:maleate cis-trans isomerase